MNRFIRTAALVCMVSNLAFVSAADTITLKSGAKLDGTVLEYNDEMFYLKVDGGKISFTYSEVVDIQKNSRQYAPKKYVRKPPPGKSEGALEPLSAKDLQAYSRLLRSLDSHTNEEEDSGFNDERKALIRGIVKLGPPVSPYLKIELANGNTLNRPYLADALVRTCPDADIKSLTPLALTDPDDTVRELTLKAMMEVNPEKFSDVFTKACHDTIATVRIAAVEGLGLLDDQKAISTLMQSLDDDIPNVQMAAVGALQKATGLRIDSVGEWQEWYQDRDSVEAERHINT